MTVFRAATHQKHTLMSVSGSKIVQEKDQEDNKIWICEHFDLKSDLQILLHLWLSKCCCVPNGSYYCYILFVIMTVNRNFSLG